MPSILSTDKNKLYGGTVVTQKYSPLVNIGLVGNLRKNYSAMLQDRIGLLANRNLLPSPLSFLTPNWVTLVNNENNVNATSPIVVVSSNRSKWIAQGAAEAAKILNGLNKANFDNVNDQKAITGDGDVSPALYLPQRINDANKRVYILVHASEYNDYKTNLAGTNINVVGWRFTPPLLRAGYHRPALTGFGASRFAAIQFCKTLQANTPNATWKSAWLLDDNVIFLSNFPNFTYMENQITNNDYISVGMSGGSAAKPRWFFQVKVPQKYQGTPNDWGTVKDTGILQQAVLWNITRLNTNHLNFSPCFVASGEDVSLGNFFDANAQKYPYKWSQTINVFKQDVELYDNTRGSDRVNSARAIYTEAMATFANNITVSPTGSASSEPEQSLAKFAVNVVLPDSQLKKQKNNSATQDKTKCQAIEQILCAAIKKGWVASAEDAFKVNGTNAQVVNTIDN